MGKAQKTKAMRRHNPMRVPDSHIPKGLASATSSSTKTEAILPILQKMGSEDPAERKWACVAVSNLIMNDPSTRRLLQGKNVVGLLITRLVDTEEEVVIEAAGALRNLCVDGGYDICAEMFNKTILPPLRTFIPKISNTLSQFLEAPKNAPENAQKLIYEFADNVITILWCLSETSNKALNAINDVGLIPFLMSFLASRSKLPLATVTSAAQCLYVLTDDNRPAINALRFDPGYVACLHGLVQPQSTTNEKTDDKAVTLQVLAAGILRNLSPLPNAAQASFKDVDKEIVLPLLQPVISSISLTQISDLANGLATVVAAEPTMEKLSLQDAPKSDDKSPATFELERLEGQLRTVQMALEILTGACATLPDPEPDMPASSGDNNDEEEDDDAAAEDVEMSMDAEAEVPETQTSSEANTFLPALVLPLLALIHPTTLSFPPLSAPSVHPPTTSALSAIHVGALECLNNVFLSLATTPNPTVAADKESGRKVWAEVWQALAAVGLEAGPGQERRKEFWEIAVGTLWGVGNVWKGSLVPEAEQVKLLIQFGDSTTNSQTRVKCIGTLECLAQHPESVEANGLISTYLVSMLPTASTPSTVGTEPLIQAVSALIDIYSDEGLPYDINFRQGGYVEKLAAAIEPFKKAVKAIDRRKEGGRELRMRGEVVSENMEGFVEYRKELGL